MNSETFDATCVIKLNGTSIYTQNCTAITLAAGAEQTVSFPDFTAPAANDLYEITVTTNLTGDLDPANDSRTEGFDTYTTPEIWCFLKLVQEHGVSIVREHQWVHMIYLLMEKMLR